jgi:tetratricopeptide (TPR) repeat protein
MSEITDAELAKAAAFFERGRQVAETGNFDYAIEMYVEGLRCAPDSVEEGHIPLHQLGLLRMQKGGKPASMVEKLKFMRGKNALEQMLNAEHLFAKDPEHLGYAQEILKAAVSGTWYRTAKWIADLIFEANNASRRPSVSVYLLLKDAYRNMGQYDRALSACQYASRMRPADGELADEFKRLSAESTLARGKYDHAQDFRDSIKDREAQERLQAQEGTVKSADYRTTVVDEARRVLARNPESAASIINLAEILSGLEEDEGENEAVDLLGKAYERTKDFSFKDRAGRIRMKQLRRHLRDAKRELEQKRENPEVQAKVEQISSRLNDISLEHYRLCVQNYPTDLRVKFEYGVRLIQNGRYDEAIPLFQEAQRDPQRRIPAMSKIGQCFFEKGWHSDAVDVFSRAIEEYEIKDDGIAKELRYNLGRAYEERGDDARALDVFRKIAQLDFAYRDVSKRVDALRKKGTQTTSQ